MVSINESEGNEGDQINQSADCLHCDFYDLRDFYELV